MLPNFVSNYIQNCSKAKVTAKALIDYYALSVSQAKKWVASESVANLMYILEF